MCVMEDVIGFTLFYGEQLRRREENTGQTKKPFLIFIKNLRTEMRNFERKKGEICSMRDIKK